MKSIAIIALVLFVSLTGAYAENLTADQMRALARDLPVLGHEEHTDDKSVWRQLTLVDGKVAAIEEGTAIVTKRPPKP